MREVVDDGDAVDLGFDFEAALDAFEGLERGGDAFFRDAARKSESRGGGGVPDVVFAGQCEFEVGPGLVVVEHSPRSTAGIETEISDFPVGTRAGTIAIHRAECLRENALEAGTFG